SRAGRVPLLPPRPQPRPPLFPYTTLFRSREGGEAVRRAVIDAVGGRQLVERAPVTAVEDLFDKAVGNGLVLRRRHPSSSFARSRDRKSTRLNSSHVEISYAVFCLKNKKRKAAGRPRPLAEAWPGRCQG